MLIKLQTWQFLSSNDADTCIIIHTTIDQHVVSKLFLFSVLFKESIENILKLELLNFTTYFIVGIWVFFRLVDI